MHWQKWRRSWIEQERRRQMRKEVSPLLIAKKREREFWRRRRKDGLGIERQMNVLNKNPKSPNPTTSHVTSGNCKQIVVSSFLFFFLLIKDLHYHFLFYSFNYKLYSKNIYIYITLLFKLLRILDLKWL